MNFCSIFIEFFEEIFISSSVDLSIFVIDFTISGIAFSIYKTGFSIFEIDFSILNFYRFFPEKNRLINQSIRVESTVIKSEL